MKFPFSIFLAVLAWVPVMQGAEAKAKAPAASKASVSKNGPKWQKLLPQTPAGYTLKTLTVADYPEHKVELYVYVPEAEGTWPCILDIPGAAGKSGRWKPTSP